MSGCGYWPEVEGTDWCGKFEIDPKLWEMYKPLRDPEVPDDVKVKLRAAISKKLVSR